MIWLYFGVPSLAFALGGWLGIEWHAGRDAIAEKQARENAAELIRLRGRTEGVSARKYEADKARIETKFVVITQEVERVVQKPFYISSDQCFDDDGLRLIREAISATGATSEPDGSVPRPSPAK